MDIKTEKLTDGQIEIRGEMSWLEFKPYCQKALARLGKDVHLKGFRKGKAPKDLVENTVSAGKVLREAAQAALKAGYLKAVSQHGLEPVGPPQAEVLKLAEGNPFQFKVKITVLPEVKLPDYKRIAQRTEKKEARVEEKEVETALRRLQKTRAKTKEKQGGAEKGDLVWIRYQSPQIENNKQFEDKFILGSGGLLEGFEEHLTGMKKGERREFKLIFPPDYKGVLAEGARQAKPSSVAGSKADFKVVMEKVESVELPELTDAFAKSLGRFNSLKELRQGIEQGVAAQKRIVERQKWREGLMEKLRGEVNVSLPANLVEVEQERLFNSLKKDIEQMSQGPFQSYLQETGKKEEEIRQGLKKEAEKTLKNFFILREIAKQEGVEVSDKETAEMAKQALNSYPQPEHRKIDKEN